MSDPSGPPAPNPRLVVWAIVAIVAVQVLYAGIEILGDGLDTTTSLRTLAGVGFVAYVALLAVLVVGALRRMRWTWHVAVAMAVFGLVLSLVQFLAGDPISQRFLGIIIDGGLLVYLFRPGVRAFFDA